jgi:colanic acid/amylovoran biosynthesis glycosyltransferase
MNWMYFHLRRVPRYRPVIMTGELQNRDQYPELEAFAAPSERLGPRVWRKLAGKRPYPSHLARARGYQPVVLHSHFGYVGYDDLGLHEALGLPWLVAFYGADVYLVGRRPEWRERYRRLFERLDLAIALGPVMRDALIDLGCPPEKVAINPLGVDVEEIPHAERRLQPGERLEILFAGTFREKKGVGYLLDAVGLLRDRGVSFRLHLVGDASKRPTDAEEKARILAALDRLALGDDQLRRYPWLEFKDLLDLAMRSHIFVAPSVTAPSGDAEGTPAVILQMMTSGMPVVSTRHSDIPLAFGPLSDRLVPERDPGALADRLTHYAENPGEITADGAAMRKRMLEEFDIRRCAGNLAALYDRVLA